MVKKAFAVDFGLTVNSDALAVNSTSLNSTANVSVTGTTHSFAGNATFGNVTFSGVSHTISGNLNFDSGTLFVDATNNRIGIGNTAPTVSLTFGGTDAVKLPVGNNSTERPTAANGMIRYNSTNSVYEFVYTTTWDSHFRLNVGGQTINGGAFIVTANNGIKNSTSGAFVVNCSLSSLQSLITNGAHTVSAPTTDGACEILFTNGTNAGAVTFSGFTVGGVGDSLTTTSGHRFIVAIRRIAGISAYTISALQ